jgi:hypothetical protein
MIIIRISGGIGNQLFQYALGRALSLRNNDELKLDISFYGLGIEPDRSFKMAHFNIPNISDIIATPADFNKVGIPAPARQDVFSKIWRVMHRLLESRKPLHKRRVVLEPKFGFCPEILKIEGNCYLSGVWQSEKYFAGCTEQIRKDFELAVPLSGAAAGMTERIRSAGDGSISVHVRRGDQVDDPKLLKKHGRLDRDYYLPAAEYAAGMVRSPHLFVFSDDISWCENNMLFNLPTTYVGAQTGSPTATETIPDYEELFLMSLCKHNIIAKSSFSWWGAWLNKNPYKIVIAPKQRFGTETGESDDLIPGTWVKI